MGGAAGRWGNAWVTATNLAVRALGLFCKPLDERGPIHDLACRRRQEKKIKKKKGGGGGGLRG